MSDKVHEGDKVSWNWNGSHPGGKVGEVKAGEVTVTSHRGNDISKTGDDKNPAVHIERSGNDVVKLASELKVDKKGSESGTGDKKSTTNGSKPAEKSNGETAKKNASQSTNGHAEGKKGANDHGKSHASTEATFKKSDAKVEEEKKEAAAKHDAGTEKKDAAEKKNGNAAKKDAPPKGTSATKETANETKDDETNKRPAPADGPKKAGRPAKKAKTDQAPKKVPATGKAERKTRSQGPA